MLLATSLYQKFRRRESILYELKVCDKKFVVDLGIRDPHRLTIDLSSYVPFIYTNLNPFIEPLALIVT